MQLLRLWADYSISVVSSRFQLPQHCCLWGIRPLLCGAGGPLPALCLHRAGGWLFLLLLLTGALLLPVGGFPQGHPVQDCTPLPGSLHGDTDVWLVHPGARASPAGPQRWGASAGWRSARRQGERPVIIRVCLSVFLLLLPGLFEVRVQEYLDSFHENEHRRVNRFLKGLGKVALEGDTVIKLNSLRYLTMVLMVLLLHCRKQDEISVKEVKRRMKTAHP